MRTARFRARGAAHDAGPVRSGLRDAPAAGALAAGGARQHLDASQAPVYTEQDVIRETRTSREFEAITGETQRRLGRVLSNEELKILLSVYRYLGLPGEVISILVNYCIQRQRSRGISRMPSLRSIEKEAYYWADHGIDTMEQAAVYMQNQLLRQSQLGKIRELFGITGRRLTTGEENYILTWLSWGFGEQEIGLAYEKTCMATGGLKWPYCNSILRSWHEQGFTTLSQIESGDRAPAKPPAAGKYSRGVQHHDDTLSDLQIAAIDRMLNEKVIDHGVFRAIDAAGEARLQSEKKSRTSSPPAPASRRSMKSSRVWVRSIGSCAGPPRTCSPRRSAGRATPAAMQQLKKGQSASSRSGIGSYRPRDWAGRSDQSSRSARSAAERAMWARSAANASSELCRQEQKKGADESVRRRELLKSSALTSIPDQYDAKIAAASARSSCATYRAWRRTTRRASRRTASRWLRRTGWERRSCPPVWRASSRSGVFVSYAPVGSCLPP